MINKTNTTDYALYDRVYIKLQKKQKHKERMKTSGWQGLAGMGGGQELTAEWCEGTFQDDGNVFQYHDPAANIQLCLLKLIKLNTQNW